MAEKIVLIPEGAWHQNEEIERRKTVYPTLLRLENEISNLLESQLHTDFEKVKLLNQLQQKYKLIQSTSEPVKIDIVQENSITNHSKNADISEILNQIPKRSQNKAEKILALIKENVEKINWDEQLRLVIDGRPIEKTNIVELVKTAAAQSKRQVKPEGSVIFEQYLNSIASPLSSKKQTQKLREQTSRKKPSAALLLKTPGHMLDEPDRKRKLTEWIEE